MSELTQAEREAMETAVELTRGTQPEPTGNWCRRVWEAAREYYLPEHIREMTASPIAARSGLLAYMENWSEDHYCAGWLTGLADTMVRHDDGAFRLLVENAGGWYVWGNLEREFVSGTWDELVTNGSGEGERK